MSTLAPLRCQGHHKRRRNVQDRARYVLTGWSGVWWRTHTGSSGETEPVSRENKSTGWTGEVRADAPVQCNWLTCWSGEVPSARTGAMAKAQQNNARGTEHRMNRWMH